MASVLSVSLLSSSGTDSLSLFLPFLISGWVGFAVFLLLFLVLLVLGVYYRRQYRLGRLENETLRHQLRLSDQTSSVRATEELQSLELTILARDLRVDSLLQQIALKDEELSSLRTQLEETFGALTSPSSLPSLPPSPLTSTSSASSLVSSTASSPTSNWPRLHSLMRGDSDSTELLSSDLGPPQHLYTELTKAVALLRTRDERIRRQQSELVRYQVEDEDELSFFRSLLSMCRISRDRDQEDLRLTARESTAPRLTLDDCYRLILSLNEEEEQTEEEEEGHHRKHAKQRLFRKGNVLMEIVNDSSDDSSSKMFVLEISRLRRSRNRARGRKSSSSSRKNRRKRKRTRIKDREEIENLEGFELELEYDSSLSKQRQRRKRRRARHVRSKTVGDESLHSSSSSSSTSSKSIPLTAEDIEIELDRQILPQMPATSGSGLRRKRRSRSGKRRSRSGSRSRERSGSRRVNRERNRQ